jgi:hypothetical protein
VKWLTEKSDRGKSSAPPETDLALDQLAEVIQAIKASLDLQAWFRKLSELTEGERSNRILRTTINMATKGGSHRLINAFWLLSNANIYRAVRLALLEDGIEV